MNILNKVTLQSLKKNKTRTVVTVIGIMLSAAMICAVTTSVSSLRNYALENMIYQEGNWHGSAFQLTEEQKDSLITTPELETAVYSQRLGYGKAEGCINEYKPYLYLLGTGEGFEEMMPVHITAGRYPKAPNEILLPEHLAENGGVIYRLGDVLSLPLGERKEDGYTLGQHNPLSYENGGEEEGEEPGKITVKETLEIRETRTYTVVGFYERPAFEEYSAPGYTALTVADETPREGSEFDLYFRMKTPKAVYDFITNLPYEGTWNSEVLTLLGISRYNTFYSVLYGMAAVIIGLILFGSVSLIYNAFSISVSERTKQFGLLSSLGATKKQLRGSVFFEAFAVSVVGIPLGILAGIGGIGVTLFLIRDRFVSLFGNNIPMKLSVSWLSVLLAVIVAGVTVAISAWIPSRRATKVSAVQAIRLNRDITTKGKDVKTPKTVYKLFGLPGMIANKHYKRNRKKYRTTVVSLFMSVVLFVSASAFCDYMRISAREGLGATDYSLRYSVYEENFEEMGPDELLDRLRATEHVTEAVYSVRQSNMGWVSPGLFSEEYRKEIGDNVQGDKIFYATNEYYIPDEDFEKILNQNGLKKEDYFKEETSLALAVGEERYFDAAKNKFVNRNLLSGDTYTVEIEHLKEVPGYTNTGYEYRDDGTRLFHYTKVDDENDKIKVPEADVVYVTEQKAGAIVQERPYYLTSRGVALIYPISQLEKNTPGQLNYYNYYLKSDNHLEAFERVREVLVGNGFTANSLYDYDAQYENEGNLLAIIEVFSYGFIVLISLIAAANVFNTVSTNIALRRREFAMLKSVGMTRKGFRKMMNFECLLYGTRSLMWGLPVSVAVTFLIHLIVNNGFETAFRFPWSAMGIAVFSVFAVVFASMVYAMEKIKKDNPIEALKNENI